jgi:hypothetical protein
MKRHRKLYTAVLIGTFCVCYYLFVTYSFHFNLKLDPYIPISLGMFFSFVFVIFLWGNFRQTPRWLYLLKCLLVVAGFGLVYLSAEASKSKYIKQELRKNGVYVSAKVIGYKTSTSRYGRHIYAIFVYDFDQNRYAQKVNNDSDFFRINDSLQLLCSSHDPEMVRVISVKHQYDKNVYSLQGN